VTGNFIVFAYQLVNHADAYSWVKRPRSRIRCPPTPYG
jgi:hypothetical protein